MSISQKLLTEILKWNLVKISGGFYHGCREDDLGIELGRNRISGPKWFSNDEQNAGNYAWSGIRINSQTKPFCIKVELNDVFAIERPQHFDINDNWGDFLQSCFPGVYGYEKSIVFQTTLLEHLKHRSEPNVSAYCSFNCLEICIPESEKIVKITEKEELPLGQHIFNNRFK